MNLTVTFKAAIRLFLLLGAGSAAFGTQLINIDQMPKVRWGIYQILWSPGQFERELDQQLAQLGGKPQYVMFFRDLFRERGFPLEAVKICDQRGLIPVISYEPAPWHAREDTGGLGDIAGGDWDAYFRQWAQAAAGWGKPVIFRFGFEMNGDWFAWGRKPQQFKAAWRRVHHLFRQAGAENIKWMFARNVVPENSAVSQHPLT